ncbi:MAG: hypothetical protein ACRDN6_13530 [Gaiellaceae bacterium]
MAEDLALRREEEAAALVEPVRQRQGVYRYRFGLAYLALAILAGAGIGSAFVVLDRPAKQSDLWSTWRPVGSQATFDSQIANYVAGRYRLPSGNPLVLVVPGPPTISDGDTELAIRSVVIQDDPRGDANGFRNVDIGESRMYQLCGQGDRCSVGGGTPTPERLQVLRREALELALYTFKYGDDIDTVIALLPPNLGDTDDTSDDAAVALFFEKSALRNQLEQPLRRTLLSANPPQAAELDTRESLIIEQLTGNRLFLYQFQQVQAGGAVMLLARPNPLG